MADFAFISKSDLEILEALKLTNDIKCSSNSTQSTSDIQSALSSDVSVFGDVDSQATSSLPSSSNHDVSACSSFKFDPEYKTASHDVDCINMMCDLFIEKNHLQEMQNLALIKDASLIAQEIISPKNLYEVLEQVNNTVAHVVLICDKMDRIQQVLQEKPFERTLKVNPSCQKAVLKFFTTANEVMEKLQQQAESIEYYQSKNATGMETWHEELQSRLQSKILDLEKRINIISQFRDKILPTTIQNSVSTSKLDMLLS